MLRFLLCVAALAVMVLAVDASTASARGRRGGMMNCNTAPANQSTPAKAENVKATAALRIYAPAASLVAKVESALKIDLKSLQALNERPTYRAPSLAGDTSTRLADR